MANNGDMRKMAVKIEFKENATPVMQSQFINWLMENTKQFGYCENKKISNGFSGVWLMKYTMKDKTTAEANKYVYENFYKMFTHNFVDKVTLLEE